MLFPRMQSILKKNGYAVYDRPFELNIVGIRARSSKPNSFDDEIHVFYKRDAVNWNYHVFRATTDPGTFWLNNPMYERGTAILAQGQFKNAYQIGLHRGQYPALVQVAPVTIVLDYNRDNVLDFNNGERQTGVFGINIHRAQISGETKYVDQYSAGCQVFEDGEDFTFFMVLCAKHSQLYGNSFTYTLFDFRALRRETIRRLAIGTSIASTLALGFFGYREILHQNNNNKKKSLNGTQKEHKEKTNRNGKKKTVGKTGKGIHKGKGKSLPKTKGTLGVRTRQPAQTGRA